MTLRTPLLSALSLVTLTLPAHSAWTAYTTSSSDGASGYQYWGSFGSGAIGGSGGTTAQTYYNYSSSSFYSYQTIILEFYINDLLGLTPTSGLLKVYFQSANNVNINYAGDGDGAITYPESNGTTLLSGHSQASPGWAFFDVSDQVSDAFSNGYDYAKFTIRYTGQNNGTATISTHESGGQAPLLSLVPEPSAFALLGLGGLGLLLRRRR